MKCPCGSALEFSTCCEPIINSQNDASSPEALMRSRYSAYATNNVNYIFDTYALSTQKLQSIAEISAWANSTKWLKLTINDTSDDSTYPTVSFTAYYLNGNDYCSMSECSRFVKENGKWKYLDGEVTEHQDIKTIKRNDPCPCQSTKKYKKCCGN